MEQSLPPRFQHTYHVLTTRYKMLLDQKRGTTTDMSRSQRGILEAPHPLRPSARLTNTHRILHRGPKLIISTKI